MFDDTIAAISTSIGTGGIGIIRVSGSKAFSIVQNIFIGVKNKSIENNLTHKILYGNIIEPSTKKIVDECLLMVMKAPSTYTKEDIIEINCHGGILSVQKVLQTVLEAGARLAEPGEFTKRAFLNGRIDLSQAEAVIDIINSRTEIFHNSALNQLEGSLSVKIKSYRDELLKLIAHIEAIIDYPEHDIEDLTYKTIYNKTFEIIKNIDKLIATADTGKIIKEGIRTAIIGKPNVGKSSLLNMFTKEQRAIVTDIPGTTRDILEEYININGIALKIIDTAGIRQTEDIIEKIGVEKSKNAAQKADLILVMLDNSKPIEQEDLEVLQLIKNKKYLLIINKTDLPSKLDYSILYDYVDKQNILELSIKKNQGIDNLEEHIENMFFKGDINMQNDIFITNIRHKDSLIRAKMSLEEVISTIKLGMPEDCISIDLQDAYQILGEIIGQSVDEDIIDKIFSQFCLGK